MEVLKTALDGVLILEPRVFEDSRGYFMESFSQREFDAKVAPILGHSIQFIQDNESMSSYGVMRGLHYQCMELTAENHRQFFIPRGFAHGFAVLSNTALFQYKCDNFYHPEADGGINILDETLNINWRIPLADAILSEKDLKHTRLADAILDFDIKDNLY